jgi:hypothetical protein
MVVAERLTEYDLNAMEARTYAILAPEGAQSWHKLDVTALLTEVRELRSEISQARQHFVDDGVNDEGDLHDLATAWKEHATGFWLKAQTKKLRDDASKSRQDAALATQELAAAQDSVVSLHTQLQELWQRFHALETLLAQTSRDSTLAITTQRDKTDEARAEVARLTQELANCHDSAVQRVQMAESLNAERRETALELLREAAVLIGGN